MGKQLSRAIKRLRAERGLTQEALARRADISHGYVARLEIGRHDPKLSTLLKIAKALGTPIADLLSWQPSRHEDPS